MEAYRRKILVFIDWYLPGYKAGGPITSLANMVTHLCGYFDFYIVTRNTEYMETTPYSNVKSDEWNRLEDNVNVYYCSAKNIRYKTWVYLMSDKEYDAIYINGIYSVNFSIKPLLAAKFQKKKNIIVSPRGMLASSAIAVKGGKKKVFLKLVSLFGFYKGVNWHATNEKEKCEIISILDSKASVTVAANLPRNYSGKLQIIEKAKGKLKICSLARISPEKNTLFAIQCLQQISDSCEVEFDIHGQIYNNDYWGECQQAIKLLPPNVKVSYKGTVPPHEVLETIAKYHLMFLPTRGENFGHVILESFMAGRPVLISDQTPWKGLQGLKAGWDFPLDDQSLFGSSIKQVGEMDQGVFNNWCDGALRLALKNENSRLVEEYVRMLGDF